MIRFVDMRDAEDCDSFALWDTGVDSFVVDRFGGQSWQSFEEYKRDARDYPNLSRVFGLLPAWAKGVDL